MDSPQAAGDDGTGYEGQSIPSCSQGIPPGLSITFLCVWSGLSAVITALHPFCTPLAAFVVAIIIAGCVLQPDSRLSRMLQSRWLVYLGTISYTVYLWQQLFTGPHVYWWSIPGLATVSYFAHRFVEFPAMKLKNLETGNAKSVRHSRAPSGFHAGSEAPPFSPHPPAYRIGSLETEKYSQT